MERNLSKKVALAEIAVPKFKNLMEDLRKGMMVTGLTYKTFISYSRKLADLTLYFNKLPEDLSEAELRDYLSHLIQHAKSLSESEFKTTVYSLRYYFKIRGKETNIKVPKLKFVKKLPAVLSKEECKTMFDLTTNFKHRLILQFIYAGGLRLSELINIKWIHVDADRMSILIKRSKGKKDRYVPLSPNLLSELTKYMINGHRGHYIFNGGAYNQRICDSSISFILKSALRRANIKKEGVCLHTLRHSYATHLLEAGLDIFSIKELLGHTNIQSTLVYLHVTDQNRINKFSPLDKLLGQKEDEEIVLIKKKYNELSLKRNKEESQLCEQLGLFD
ncbi:tyrosine-type recombinase/integrase [Aurantibacillus circumpalustris]|uniref:tyrosine-type recombinase/integrase n=1 Tax=Aurantibacillus circumpalustris TaxID=3036359 RepID=UPI00295ABE07|nr:tyrosine-type recombinase/integrase [Aurantibacillus circumpalustris]